MQLTARLNSPHALFRKLELESCRAYHAMHILAAHSAHDGNV
jgi:hypothetical protein